MYLYLVQHAEAKPKEIDPDRSLSENGIETAEKVASFVGGHSDIRLTTIVHSGKKRALQTAEIFAEKLQPVEGIRQEKELEPLSTPWGWVERLAQINNNIMIVGHLPHLKRLNALLLCQDENKPIVEFQMAGVICLFRNESGIWTIEWMVIPRIL